MVLSELGVYNGEALVPRPYLERLLDQGGPLIAVDGMVGSGRRSLVAVWAARRQRAGARCVLILESPTFRDPGALLAELATQLGVPVAEEAADTLAALCDVVAQADELVIGLERTVHYIDNRHLDYLNQLIAAGSGVRVVLIGRPIGVVMPPHTTVNTHERYPGRDDELLQICEAHGVPHRRR